MTKLFLHIGQPKTATTTIQSFLSANREAMIPHGWLYPIASRQYAGHHHLGNFFRPDPLHWIKVVDPQKTRDALLREIEETGCGNVILSTESLYFAKDVEACRRYFDGFDTRIVVFLRRQDEWIESAYQENLKNGETNIGADRYMQVHQPAMDYAANMRRWAEVFGAGNIIVHPFERGESRLDVESVFLNAVGAPEGMELRKLETMNERLNRDCTAFLTLFQAQPRVDMHHQFVKDLLSEYSLAHPDPVELRHMFPPARRRALLQSCEAGNAEVARKYLGRGDGKLFTSPWPAADEPWTPYEGLRTRASVKIAEHVIGRLYHMLEAAQSAGQATSPKGGEGIRS